MNRKVPLLFPWALATFFALFGPLLFPMTRLVAFAPFFAILYHRTLRLRALWIASLCGLILDCANAQMRFGTFAFSFCATTFILHRQKRHFFEEKPLSLVLFTILISIVSSTLHLLFLAMFESPPPFSTATLILDILGMSILDGLYAFFWFYLPMVFYSWASTFHWKKWFFSLFSASRKEQDDLRN